MIVAPFSASLPSSPLTPRREKADTAAENQELPPRHGTALGPSAGSGGGWAKTADLRVADQCSPAQEPHLPGSIPQPATVMAFSFPAFHLRSLHTELFLRICKNGHAGFNFCCLAAECWLLRKRLRWIAITRKFSSSHIVTIYAIAIIMKCSSTFVLQNLRFAASRRLS